jgi:hypothetical protein
LHQKNLATLPIIVIITLTPTNRNTLRCSSRYWRMKRDEFVWSQCRFIRVCLIKVSIYLSLFDPGIDLFEFDKSIDLFEFVW